MPDFGPYTEWSMQPGETEFQTTDLNGDTYTATLDELTGGAYSLSGRNIINNSTGRFAGSVSPNFESRFIDQGKGSFLFVNMTDESGVNTFGKTTVVNAVNIETTFLAPDGTEQEINIPYASINRVGKQLTINDTDEENITYRWADIGTENLAPGYRYATTSEAANYGITSALLRNYRSLVTQIADQGIEDENGNPIETITDAAQYLAGLFQSGGQYAHIYQFNS
ncbi:MAG TPA: hypothetical protein VGF75_06825 [Candidatus Saccharimonadales bacterium]|jgi:sporulation protein YlmC with PRC-barrel domain